MPVSNTQKGVGDILRGRFAQYTIHENIRPSWLTSPKGERLELDFYIEELRIAFEVQGLQHYVFTPHFHTKQSVFQAQLDRDASKRVLCDQLEIALYEVTNAADLTAVLDTIQFGERIEATLKHGEYGHDQLKINYLRNATSVMRGKLNASRNQLHRIARRMNACVQAGNPIPTALMEDLKNTAKSYRAVECRLLRSTAETAQYYDRWIVPQVEAGGKVLHKLNVEKAIKRNALGPDLRSLKAHCWSVVGSHIHWLYMDRVENDNEIWKSECGSFERMQPKEVSPELVAQHEDKCCVNCLASCKKAFERNI